ncbi:DUF4386 domain-containing protein [Pontiella agarivorans]|uniref:DUF4386 domain-containing protein n=1 Tax=Pontiella agarivorans TaxID=3038953 RepID=A0ABU5MZ71_9BACT|nr:DUF4386 domain-containing protein [Pontiella agarivorans]MDZ8119502.1 DUF4386 domain-containing protein [Pontiella agarivorans]
MQENANSIRLAPMARLAGLLYLVIIVCGIFAEAGVRMRLIEFGDPTLTAANIRASDMLFRAGFAADTIMLFCDVAIAILFYTLLKSTGKTLALTATAFRLVQAAILGAGLLHCLGALLLLDESGYGSLFAEQQSQALALLLLDLHGHGYDLGLLFFAVSNFILGYLLIKSRLFPAFLGYGLQAAAAVYLVGGYIRFLLPDFLPFVQVFYVIPLIAELSFGLWLFIRGVGTPSAESRQIPGRPRF